MAASFCSLNRHLALLLTVGALAATGQTAAADSKKPQPAKTGKSPATQTIELGNVGEKARVDIKQVQGVDPKELTKVLDLLAKRDADARKYEQRAAELEKELQKARDGAVTRVLAEAAQPQAEDLAKRARDALLKGDTTLAEQLLRQQENTAATAAEAKRHEAADLARQIAALSIGRDSQIALAALERAARYEPENFWTQVQLGDTQAVLGQSQAAMASYKTAQAIAETLAARDPANTEWQRDLSVSHSKIGDVLVAQGDGPGALAAYRKGLVVREALAARDPANTQWQRDLSVSHNKIGDVLVAQGDGPGALVVYRKAQTIAETLAEQGPANTLWQTDLAVSCAKLGTLGALDKTERRTWLRRGLGILRTLRAAGRLPPNMDWSTRFEELIKALDDGGPAP